MGNYSGTIRCGHCYNEGHNRAGCERLTEQYMTEWEYCKNNVDPTAYRFTRVREQLAKRTAAAYARIVRKTGTIVVPARL